MTKLPAGRSGSICPAAPMTASRGGLRGLTSNDLQRIAVAIDADVAESTRTTYASGWRS